MIFNLFNSGTPKDIMEQAKETYQVPPMPEVKLPVDECPYTVGITQSGRTVLKIESDHGIVTLTMDHAAVLRLIRMLEATLPEVDDNQEDQE